MCRRRCLVRGRCPSTEREAYIILSFFVFFPQTNIHTQCFYCAAEYPLRYIYLPLELRIHRAYRDRISPTRHRHTHTHTSHNRSHATCCFRCGNGVSFVPPMCIYKTSKIGNKTQTALFSYLKRFYASSLSTTPVPTRPISTQLHIGRFSAEVIAIHYSTFIRFIPGTLIYQYKRCGGDRHRVPRNISRAHFLHFIRAIGEHIRLRQ